MINNFYFSLVSNKILFSWNRLQGEHGQYYRTALRYLGCTDLDTLSIEKQHEHAFFLGLAALLGDGVYNLGELVS